MAMTNKEVGEMLNDYMDIVRMINKLLTELYGTDKAREIIFNATKLCIEQELN